MMVLSSFLLLAVSQSPKKTDDGWTLNPLSASVVAQRMDAAVSGLKGVYATSTVSMILPTGKGATPKPLEAFIESKNRYLCNYLIFPDGKPRLAALRGDGKLRYRVESVGMASGDPREMTSLPGAKGRPLTSRDFAPKPNDLLAKWPYLLSKAVYSPLVDSYPTFSNLVAAAAKAGAKPKVYEKKFVIQNVPQRYYSIRWKKGNLEYEVMAHSVIYLPTQILVHEGRKFAVEWTGNWQSGQKFQQALFEAKTSN